MFAKQGNELAAYKKNKKINSPNKIVTMVGKYIDKGSRDTR